MSDHIYIEKGRPPWRPSESATLLDVFHRFTIPLVGVIEQHEVKYLFWCVVGHAGSANAWAYAHIDEGSFDLGLLRAATHENLAHVLASAVKDRSGTFAIASEDKGILEWVILEPPADFESVHQRGMEELGAKMNEAMAEMQHLMEQYPSIRAVSNFAIAPSPRLSGV